MRTTDVDVAELALGAQRDAAAAIHRVVAHAELRRRRDELRLGSQPRVERDQRRAQAQRAVRPALVVIGAEAVEQELQVRQGVGHRLLGEESLLGLMESLHLAAGLWVIRRGMDAADPQTGELALEKHPAAGKDSAVVAEECGGQAVHAGRGEEHLHDVGRLHGGERDRRERQARVIVDEVDDLGRRPIAEGPMRGVGLPELIGQLRREAGERGARPLVWLGGVMSPWR